MGRILLLLAFTLPAFGWGTKGHEVAARMAHAALPKDFPAFFLAAGERLVYLCPEPDRWRSDLSPALQALNVPDHYFDLELWGDPILPSTRYGLLLEAVKRGLVGEGKPVSGLGTAPLAIAELAERLVTHFRQWRETPRREVEEGAIYTSGILAHFVTDLSNPLHCTIHHDGWMEKYPNSRGIHSRFETVYVDQAVHEKDIQQRLPAPRRLGPWVPEMEQFVRRNNRLVETVYEMDQKTAFGSGPSSSDVAAAAHDFTAQRLADGAAMLRDVWHTAWLVAGEQWLVQPVTLFGRKGVTVLELLKSRGTVETKSYEWGQMVTAIGHRKNGLDGRYWRYTVNGKPAGRAADKYVTSDGERIEWRFEK